MLSSIPPPLFSPVSFSLWLSFCPHGPRSSFSPASSRYLESVPLRHRSDLECLCRWVVRYSALSESQGVINMPWEPGTIPPEAHFGNDRRIECPPPLNILTSMPLLWDNTIYECGLLDVPLDYHDASVGNARLAVIKANATGERRGTVFMNPGP